MHTLQFNMFPGQSTTLMCCIESCSFPTNAPNWAFTSNMRTLSFNKKNITTFIKVQKYKIVL